MTRSGELIISGYIIMQKCEQHKISTVSGPVRDLQTNSPDNSTLIISWRPPTTPNGNIISYTVRIENLRDGTTLRDIVDFSAATTSLTENGLGTLMYKLDKDSIMMFIL